MIVTEKKILVCSALITVVGLIVLCFTVMQLEQQPLQHKEFLDSPEVRVVIQGNITATREYENMQFVTIKTSCELPGVYFSLEKVALGESVLIGTKKYYKGKPEIIIESIRSQERNETLP